MLFPRNMININRYCTKTCFSSYFLVRTKININRYCTKTPFSFVCVGTDEDDKYQQILYENIVEQIRKQPAGEININRYCTKTTKFNNLDDDSEEDKYQQILYENKYIFCFALALLR